LEGQTQDMPELPPRPVPQTSARRTQKNCDQCGRPYLPTGNYQRFCGECKLQRSRAIYVAEIDLPLFVSDPLREEKLGWTAVKVCRLCGLKLAKLPQHLLAKHRDVLAEGLDNPTPRELLLIYRKRFGYNKTAPLASADFGRAMSKEKIASRRKPPKRSRFARGQKKDPRSTKGTSERLAWGVSKQSRQNQAKARQGRPMPKLRHSDSLGRTIPDWAVVKPRLGGMKARDIAADVSRKYGIPITPGAVAARLQRILGVTKHPCRFDRGRAVTEQRLIAHWNDMQLVRDGKVLKSHIEIQCGKQELGPEELAALLKVAVSWVYGRCSSTAKSPIPHFRRAGRLLFRTSDVAAWVGQMQHGKSAFRSRDASLRGLAKALRIGVHRLRELVVQSGGPQDRRNRKKRRKPDLPLSWNLATRLLEEAEPTLKKEGGSVAASARGGNPEALLSSEKRAIPREYPELTSDCRHMLDWASKESNIEMGKLGEWMCAEHAAGRIRAILLWPSIHQTLLGICTERTLGQNSRPLSERVKDLLAEAHECSVATIERVIASSRRTVMTAA
jgi:hypothetical protein